MTIRSRILDPIRYTTGWLLRAAGERLMEGVDNGHRQDSEDREGGTRALPAGTPGERPGGAEPETRYCPGVKSIRTRCVYGYAGRCLFCGTEKGAPENAAPEPEPVAQEILAWRGWRLCGDEPTLYSLSRDVAWGGPTLTADRPPAAENEHGIYALSDPFGYNQHSSPYSVFLFSYRDMAEVWGQVALSGIVVVGTTGYRAERATIRSLILREKRAHWKEMAALPLIVALEERYQCPVDWECSAVQALP